MLKRVFEQSPHVFKLIVAISIATTVWACLQDYPLWMWLCSLAVYFFYGCLGITVTFHRYLTHHSFKLSNWKERILVFIGHLAGTGSAITWVSFHHAHHTHSDTEKDPHSPKNGIINTVLLNYSVPRCAKSKTVIRIGRDPFYRGLHDYYLGLHIVYSLCLFAIGGLSLLVFAHVVPVAITATISALSNYLSHTMGYQTYETGDNSRNDPVMAALSWGEGWHNNHHRYPGHAKFGHKWWEIDISWYVIKMIRNKT